MEIEVKKRRMTTARELEKIKRISKNYTPEELAEEMDIKIGTIYDILYRNKYPFKISPYRTRGAKVYNKSTYAKFARIRGILYEIDRMELLRGGWRQIQAMKEKYYQELLIDILLNQREIILAKQNILT